MKSSTQYSHAVAEVNLAAIRHNYRLLKSMSPQLNGMAVVKANAYGHGVDQVVNELEKTDLEWYGVATLDEAVHLRSLGVKKNILVFASPLKDDLDVYTSYNLDLCLSSAEITQELRMSAETYRVHVKIDTGMGRLGFSENEFESIFSDLESSDKIKLVGLLSHLSEAEESEDQSEKQFQSFKNLVGQYGKSFEIIHLVNSSGIARFRTTLDWGQPCLFRLGIALYGYGIPDHLLRENEELQPAMKLSSKITSIRQINAGSKISYGGTWMATEDSQIATVAIGYADGYPREYSNWAQVKLGNNYYDIVGVICMDMLMINLKANESGHKIGEEVVLFGPAGPFASQISTLAGSIPYELVTRMGARAKKVFINGT